MGDWRTFGTVANLMAPNPLQAFQGADLPGHLLLQHR
jgi:hypothetical protein